MCDTESEARETQVMAGTGLESRGHRLLFLSAINMAVAEQVLCERLLSAPSKKPQGKDSGLVCVTWYLGLQIFLLNQFLMGVKGFS